MKWWNIIVKEWWSHWMIVYDSFMIFIEDLVSSALSQTEKTYSFCHGSFFYKWGISMWAFSLFGKPFGIGNMKNESLAVMLILDNANTSTIQYTLWMITQMEGKLSKSFQISWPIALHSFVRISTKYLHGKWTECPSFRHEWGSKCWTACFNPCRHYNYKI